MAPAASRNLDPEETRTRTSLIAPIQTGAKAHDKRKSEDVVDLTEEGEPDDCRRGQRHRPAAGAEESGCDGVVDEEGPFDRFEGFHASNGHRACKMEEQMRAQSAQVDQASVEEQLVFACGACRDTFGSSAEVHDHDHSEHKQQPRVRCRRCRRTFTDIAERNHHFQTSPRHFCCRYCKHVVEFGNADSLRYHYIDRHVDLYCHFCDRHFPSTFQRRRHLEGGHWSCFACRRMFPMHELCKDHCGACYSATFGEGFPDAPTENKNGGRLPDYYAKLGIGGHSSHEQVLKAAKEMRVKTHPDRLKRREGLTDEEKQAIDAEAALVGQAADVLSDPDLRQEYDRTVRRWWID